MNKEELDEFVTELKEEPEQNVYERTMADFYEVKLTELQTEETSTDKPSKKIKNVEFSIREGMMRKFWK